VKVTALLVGLATAVKVNNSSSPSVTVLLPGSVNVIESATAETGKRNSNRIENIT
jgi:hypothetical protein